ncbi:lipase/ esterase [Calocera viscosa TUFC12733]|uniref:Lipase/ esterase n=1 Tax=Calocera viscosa (strain TUFC12733) TaxID=1330018 RepID=A0A167PRC8_CALVF|nr:lipase/ esterase [Calocera viscosa TUFC12733]
MTYRLTVGPLVPHLVPLMDEDYVHYYTNTLIGLPALDYTAPFDPSIRDRYLVGSGASEPLPVGSTRDIGGIGKNPNVRVFTPPGEKPEGGWAALVYYHGGGWVLGTIDSSAAMCTQLCIRSNCVVVSVDYRLAPEHIYPAAVEDSWDVLQWVHDHGPAEISIDPKRIAVGGGSAGGHLSAVVAHKSATRSPPIPLVYQLLLVPCTDLSPDAPYPSRTAYAHAPALPAARMQWFYGLFQAPPEEWEASPILAPKDNFAQLAPQFVAVAGLDFLKDEGIAYHEKTVEHGGKSELKVYEGVPHNFGSLDGVTAKGREFIGDAVERLNTAFGH